MISKNITKYIEEKFPLNVAESWDNVGLLIGDNSKEIKRILICLDVTDKVIDEAIKNNADMIISHHPFIFGGLKTITSNDTNGTQILKAIENRISIYSAHTNCDIAKGGLNDFLCSKLNLKNIMNLSVINKKKYKKFVVYVPNEYVNKIIEVINEAGGGQIGNYSNCTFSIHGEGTFRPEEGTNPFIGELGKLEKVKEVKLETIVPEENIKDVVRLVTQTHPYEEVAYDIFTMDNEGEEIGIGRIGSLINKVSYEDFLETVKKVLNLDVIKYTGNKNEIIQSIAICTGSGGDLINDCINKNVDVFITGEIKYHQVLEAQKNHIKVIQAGHYETEILFTHLMFKLLNNRFKNIDINISKQNKSLYAFS